MPTFKLSDGESSYEIEISSVAYVYELIDKLLEVHETSTRNGITLLFKGVPLDPSKLICDYKIKDGKKIVFSEKYNGGNMFEI